MGKTFCFNTESVSCEPCKILKRIEIIEELIRSFMCDEDKIPKLKELKKECDDLKKKWEGLWCECTINPSDLP